jgi:leucyl aminopeptidase (aminopeptidase T)
MRFTLVTETRDEYYAFELAKAARVLCEQILEVRPGQTVVMTADTQSDSRVLWATAAAVFAADAVPIVLYYHTQPRPQMELPPPIAAAVASADVWIEFAVAYTVYTHSWQRAVDAGVQYCGINGIDADGMVRCIGRQDVNLLAKMGAAIQGLIGETEMRVTSAAGTDVTFSNRGIEVGTFRMKANPEKRPIMLSGQVSWSPVKESLNGRLVADGVLYPPAEVGIIAEPIELTVSAGRIARISGGREARMLQAWLDGLNDPTLYRIAHISLGFKPGRPAPTGRILEDERAFGDIDFGFGAWLGRPAAGHFDFTCRQVSSWAGNRRLQDEGTFVEAELAALCRAMGVGRS